MIAKITKSGGNGALLYNLEKGEILDTNILYTDPKKDFCNEFDQTANQNSRVKKNIFHASLSLKEGEQVSDKKFMRIGKEYMEGMGFKDTPYTIFKHDDTKNPHIHIIASRVKNDGKCVSDKRDHYKSEKLSRKLEEKYGLEQVSCEKKGKSKSLGEINHKKHNHQSFLLKDAVENTLDDILKKSSTRKEFEAKSNECIYIRCLNQKYTYGVYDVEGKPFQYFSEKKLSEKYSFQAVNRHFSNIEQEKERLEQLKKQQEELKQREIEQKRKDEKAQKVVSKSVEQEKPIQKQEQIVTIQSPTQKQDIEKRQNDEVPQEPKKESLMKKGVNLLSKAFNSLKSSHTHKEELKPREEPKKQIKQVIVKVERPQQNKMNLVDQLSDLLINGGEDRLIKAIDILDKQPLTEQQAHKFAKNEKIEYMLRSMLLLRSGHENIAKDVKTELQFSKSEMKKREQAKERIQNSPKPSKNINNNKNKCNNRGMKM